MSQPGCVRACGGVIEKVGGVDFKCVYVSVRLCVCLPQQTAVVNSVLLNSVTVCSIPPRLSDLLRQVLSFKDWDYFYRSDTRSLIRGTTEQVRFSLGLQLSPPALYWTLEILTGSSTEAQRGFLSLRVEFFYGG